MDVGFKIIKYQFLFIHYAWFIIISFIGLSFISISVFLVNQYLYGLVYLYYKWNNKNLYKKEIFYYSKSFHNVRKMVCEGTM